MEFRWIAAITLWTMLSGPVLIHWSMVIPRPQGSRSPEARPPLVAEHLRPDWATPVVFVDDDRE